MTTRKTTITKKTAAKTLTASRKTVTRSSVTGKLLSPMSSSTSAINYYGTKSKARNAAYGRVMAFVAESKKKHASG
jgi:hypothetical protein